MAKQRELSGTLQSEDDSKLKKQVSNAKSKELSGHGIFSPPEDLRPRNSENGSTSQTPGKNAQVRIPQQTRLLLIWTLGGFPALNGVLIYAFNRLRQVSSIKFGEADDADSVVKTAKKIPTKKFNDLTGNNIFKGDAAEAPGTAEKQLSDAKLKEMSGSNIFADGKAPARDFLGGIRKPPGGESSIALV